MGEELVKLRPDRDLQCYFQQPSAVAALSDASESGFTLSGSWREQFDWAVVEWTRDNVIEHPVLRNLPDGDLRGLRLSYEEERTNCIPMDSTIYDSLGWSYLRVWEESNGAENFHWVPLPKTPVAGSYTQATAEFELQGTPTAGDYIELAWLDQHANCQLGADDTLESALQRLASFINAKGPAGGVTAEVAGTQIRLTYTGAPGANGNRVGVYGTVAGAGTEQWAPSWKMFSGGVSPNRWRVDLDFGNLVDKDGRPVSTANVRKLRWTWAADLQFGEFQRGEFAVAVSNWQVTGANRGYKVAGPGSRRIEDDSTEISYTGTWTEERGNYSGGSIRYASVPGSGLECSYNAALDHQLYLGTRYVDGGGGGIVQATVQVDAGPSINVNLKRASEDVLIRVPLGEHSGGVQHRVTVTHTGPAVTKVYFDFLEIAVPASELPQCGVHQKTTLATDWDTNHSLAIAPERTAWLLGTLGFTGRANHYAGALRFYELCCPGNRYAAATIEFAGTPQFGGTTQITIAGTEIAHANLIGDTAESIAKCFELLITSGTAAVWARAEGAVLRITARTMGSAGNGISVSAATGSTEFTATPSATTLTGGTDGKWLTDLEAAPRLNRAARDWSQSYFRALKGYGIEAAAAFSMEVGDGDDSLETGIAQRYPDGPAWLNTPALQTNFGPASTAFWERVYLDMADVMAEAGVTPYLQFGEVQWWYFADKAGMPFCDEYTKTRFETAFGKAMQTIPSEHADPNLFPDECSFLPGLIGEFTAAVMAFVRESHPNALFEVLYPPDTNDTPLNRIINFPAAHWTPSTLACLKTENFTYTGDRDLNKARDSIRLPMVCGFPRSQSSHLVGIGEYTTPWVKEQSLALGEAIESVVLFALDQYCLIGYSLELERGLGRSLFMGG